MPLFRVRIVLFLVVFPSRMVWRIGGAVRRISRILVTRKKLLDWEPRVLFREGARRTLDWYFATKDKKQVTAILNRLLTER